MKIKTRWRCHCVTRYTDTAVVKLTASAETEDKEFWNYTPSGEVTVTITNPKALDYFKPGEIYTLTFEQGRV